MEDKKNTYKGNTDARRKASRKYLTETVETIAIRVRKGDKEKIKAHAASLGMSLNEFVCSAIDAKMRES